MDLEFFITCIKPQVVYGDTDSVFVLLKGKTKEEAFDIGSMNRSRSRSTGVHISFRLKNIHCYDMFNPGEEMARVVSQEHTKPMKLKFEKVITASLISPDLPWVSDYSLIPQILLGWN